MRFARHSWAWWLKRAVVMLAGALLLIQLVPYGRNHTNPPLRRAPRWDSTRTRQLAVGACFDCHTNQTRWPWYSNIAPISWRLQQHVDGGRAALNFSEWNRRQEDAGDAAETVRDGSMPPWDYKLIHARARLSARQKAQLISGLRATLAASPPGRSH